ncbi:hypothetical protein GGI12_000438 [Dipsacomyces acuminosporus]|nr:hypothetical protein GGI12_000438 [Dipsacomyces acuminosporus]
MGFCGFICVLLFIFSALSFVDARLSGCAKSIAFQITNIYENGNTSFHYDYCEDIKDGRGFTSGIVGFTTATADAWVVIQEYHRLTGGKDAMAKYDAILQRLAKSGSDSTSDLSGYCDTWKALGSSDAKFRAAQDKIRDDMYFDPAQKYADRLGLRLSITQGQLYDTGVQHGTGSSSDSLGNLIKLTSDSFSSDAPGASNSTLDINGKKVDEIVWLKKFLEIRANDLKNPREKENGSGYWAKTLYRIKSYQHAVDKQEYVWTSSVEVLDNDGNPTKVSCQTTGDTSTTPATSAAATHAATTHATATATATAKDTAATSNGSGSSGIATYVGTTTN